MEQRSRGFWTRIAIAMHGPNCSFKKNIIKHCWKEQKSRRELEKNLAQHISFIHADVLWSKSLPIAIWNKYTIHSGNLVNLERRKLVYTSNYPSLAEYFAHSVRSNL